MSKDRIAEHIAGLLEELAKEDENESIQPKLDRDLLLLCANHIQGDTHIDLYGTYDIHTDECEVCEFTLTGSKVPLWDLQPAGSNILAELTEWINGTMKSREELAQEAKYDAAMDALEDSKIEQ